MQQNLAARRESPHVESISRKPIRPRRARACKIRLMPRRFLGRSALFENCLHLLTQFRSVLVMVDLHGVVPSREWLEFGWRSLRVGEPE